MYSWKRAIESCVPSNDPTSTRAEQRQKQTCEEGFRAAENAQVEEDRRARPIVDEHPERSPWHRALEMEKDIESIGMSSVSWAPALAPH